MRHNFSTQTPTIHKSTWYPYVNGNSCQPSSINHRQQCWIAFILNAITNHLERPQWSFLDSLRVSYSPEVSLSMSDREVFARFSNCASWFCPSSLLWESFSTFCEACDVITMVWLGVGTTHSHQSISHGRWVDSFYPCDMDWSQQFKEDFIPTLFGIQTKECSLLKSSCVGFLAMRAKNRINILLILILQILCG